MRSQKVNKDQLLQWITMVSFTVYDTVLYLDTHPKDQEALAYFNHYNRMRDQLMSEYSELYGPLTLDTAEVSGNWDWATNPWPWEGGC